MLFFAFLTAITFQLSEVTVVSCESSWLDSQQLSETLAPELGEMTAAERADLLLVVDQCTAESLRIRAIGSQLQRERLVQIAQIPEEARIRTIALALGELAKEAMGDAQTENDGTSMVVDAVAATERESAEASVEVGAAKTSREVVAYAHSSTYPGENHGYKNFASSTKVETPRDKPEFFWGGWLRVFPVASTIAPEGRLGLRVRSWRFDLGGYAMRWKESGLGSTGLLAVTGTAGPVLWYYKGSVYFSVDAHIELGGIGAWGKSANAYVDEKRLFNLLIGGHWSFWLGIPIRKRLLPTVVMDIGWVRGLNVFAGETMQGGFEGPSMSAGIVLAW